MVGHVFSFIYTYSKKKKAIFVLGGPGAGKTTLCERLQKEFHYFHLSVGNLLRQELERGDSPEAATIKHHLSKGTLVPSWIACKLLKRDIDEAHHVKLFCLDGFPRNRESLDCWDKETSGHVAVNMVVLLEAEKNVLQQRCLEREGRVDDNPETLKTRFHVYETETLPFIEHLKQNYLVKTVYSGDSKENVFEQVVSLIHKIKHKSF